MMRPLQPCFKIRVHNGKKIDADTLKGTLATSSNSGDYLDIEKCVALPVVYEEQTSYLNTLNFTVDKFADVLLYYFKMGQKVSLYGGYYEDGGNLRLVFNGTVSRIRTKFSDNGLITISVECISYGFTKMGKNAKSVVYPDPNSDRAFAKANSLSVKEIIEGICKDCGVEVGVIDPNPKNSDLFVTNKDFSATFVAYQREETDWKFINRLAKRFGCSVWISSEDGVDKLNFVHKDKASAKQSDISFLFPLYGRIKDVRESEMQRFSGFPENDRPRLLRQLSVDEDISAAYSVSRSAVYFDKETGEEKSSVAQIKQGPDGRNEIVFYELDQSRVEEISRTRPELAKQIRNSNPMSRPWGDPTNPEHISYYYKEIRKYDEHIAVFDGAFFGITVSAKCNQDLDIRSHRTYAIRGILSYHSTNLESRFFLRGLKHIWDYSGTWTELDFIR